MSSSSAEQLTNFLLLLTISQHRTVPLVVFPLSHKKEVLNGGDSIKTAASRMRFSYKFLIIRHFPCYSIDIGLFQGVGVCSIKLI